jgi:hypothetical protein
MEFLKAIVDEPEFWERAGRLIVLVLALLTILSLRGERNKALQEVKALREKLEEKDAE